MINAVRKLSGYARHTWWTPTLALGFVATACGGLAYGSGAGGSSTAPTYGSGAAGGTTAGAAAINVRNASLGQILTDGQGRALYLFEADHGGTSSCTTTCASVWPPFTSAQTATGAGGVTASLIGSSTRADGTHQVTYNGHPLYYYVGDTAAGDTKGQGLNQFGAGWYVVTPAGDKIDNG